MNWNKPLPCILFGSLLGTCSGEGEQPKAKPATLRLTDSMLRIVSVNTVHVCEMVDELALNGRATFNQGQVANVYPMFGGTVTELRAGIGDFVHKGEVLAATRSREMADYKKQSKEAERQLLLARQNMDATQDMHTSGMASDEDVLQAKQELVTAEVEERRIKEIFSIYHFSGNAFYQLKSPVSGFIMEKQISRDMQLRSDQRDALFTISGLSDVWMMTDVYESDISKVSEGADVRISALAYPERTFTDAIDKAYHLLDSGSKTVNICIKLKNEDYLLKPGMFTNVSVKCKTEDTPTPHTGSHAPVFEGRKNYVVTVEPDQRLEIERVDVYKQLSRECYIRSGLSEGDRVLNNNILLVYNALNADQKPENSMHKFVDNIVAFSLKDKFFILFCTVITVITGAVSFKHTPVDAFPDVTNTEVTIITQWAGRSAEEMEKFITIPIEITMNPIQKKTDIRSTTLFGLSMINVMFEDRVNDFTARQQVYSLLSDAGPPEGVTPEVQPLYGPTGEIYRYTLRSDRRSVRDLKTIQDWVIERNLRSVSGVADIVSFSSKMKTFGVNMSPHQLIDYGITSLELYDAIAESNINVGGDVIMKGSQAHAVRGIDLVNNLDELRNIVVKNINGTPTLVKNPANVHESCLPHLGQVGRMGEDDIVQGIVVVHKGENPGEVITNLKDKIEGLNQDVLPENIRIIPFYDHEDLVNPAVKTAAHNLTEGILLVTFIVLIFMTDWRTTVIVTAITPLVLLFVSVCLRVMGMSANLFSMEAIDFGITIDGAMVMVEGVFVALDKKAKEVGIPAFNVTSKMGLAHHTAKDKAKAVFFSKLVTIIALVPIFSFQKVERKMFPSLAYTLDFALLGALTSTLTLVPVMSSMLLKENVREKSNCFAHFINQKCAALFDTFYAHRKLTIGLATVVAGVGLWLFSFLETEFLPQLNESSIYIRATLPQNISLGEPVTLANKMRKKLLTFPEVRQALSQTGHPSGGTDAAGFYNIEFRVGIYPEEDWESKLTKLQLIGKMQEDLPIYPSIDLNSLQSIVDNVGETASGMKGSVVVKVFGKGLYESEKLAIQIDKILNTVQGIEGSGVIRNIGQPELRIELNERQLARYGVAKEDVQSIIEMAIGKKSASLLYKNERKSNIMVRYSEEFCQNEEEIGRILVPVMDGTIVPIKELVDIATITGPLLIFRGDRTHFCTVKFSVRGRDTDTVVTEAQKKINASVHLPTGYSSKWTGDFENQQHASKRLAQIIPISIVIIFIILFILFSNAKDAGLVLLNVPFAAMGGIAALLTTGFNFSVSAGIGFITSFGVCIQSGVIMISDIKADLKLGSPLQEATKGGVRSRIRPVIVTATMTTIGLLPAAMSHDIDSESQHPLAIVIIGGLIGATFFTLFIFPLIVEIVYERMLYDKSGKLLQGRI